MFKPMAIRMYSKFSTKFIFLKIEIGPILVKIGPIEVFWNFLVFNYYF